MKFSYLHAGIQNMDYIHVPEIAQQKKVTGNLRLLSQLFYIVIIIILYDCIFISVPAPAPAPGSTAGLKLVPVKPPGSAGLKQALPQQQCMLHTYIHLDGLIKPLLSTCHE